MRYAWYDCLFFLVSEFAVFENELKLFFQEKYYDEKFPDEFILNSKRGVLTSAIIFYPANKHFVTIHKFSSKKW